MVFAGQGQDFVLHATPLPQLIQQLKAGVVRSDSAAMEAEPQQSVEPQFSISSVCSFEEEDVLNSALLWDEQRTHVLFPNSLRIQKLRGVSQVCAFSVLLLFFGVCVCGGGGGGAEKKGGWGGGEWNLK